MRFSYTSMVASDSMSSPLLQGIEQMSIVLIMLMRCLDSATPTGVIKVDMNFVQSLVLNIRV